MLAGCNQVYGLDATRPRDAAFFDGVDAPFGCPDRGGTPRYAPMLQQVVGGCSSYTANEADTFATAICRDTNGGASYPSESVGGGPFMRITSITDPIEQARLAPEGDELFVVVRASATTMRIDAYRRMTDGWKFSYTVDPGRALSSPIYIGTPTRGPQRRMMLSVYNGFSGFELQEIEFDATAGRVVGPKYGNELGFIPYFAPDLMPDGLRGYHGTINDPSELYFDRGSLAEPFTSARAIESVPGNNDAFITANCARIYIYSSDLRTLFYRVEQVP
jgi:hypothetical protein